MAQQDQIRSASLPYPALQVIADYASLAKPEITFLVTLSAMAGFLLGTPGEIDGWRLAATMLGVALTSGGSGALNHVLEHRLDADMKRTAGRPLPMGRISPAAATVFGVVQIAAGVGMLCPLVNPLTGVLAAFTVVLYVFVYTPLKRKTKYNTLIGTLPGALPALGGWAAATGNIAWGGWTWFLILAIWQMPHFLSLAWMYRKDYGRARYAMLPVVEPDGRSTALQTLGFTALLLVAGVLPWAAGVAGPLFLVGSILAGCWFLRPAVAFYRTRSVPDARRVLMASIQYIPVLVALIVVDHFV